MTTGKYTNLNMSQLTQSTAECTEESYDHGRYQTDDDYYELFAEEVAPPRPDYSRYYTCEECNIMVDLWKDSVYLITKNINEMGVCLDCFDKGWKAAKENGWGGFNIEQRIADEERVNTTDTSNTRNN
jgi:hypothetical protein